MNKTMRHAIDTAPRGTSGLVIEPWSPGETYGVAANWAEPSAPVYYYASEGWEPGQYQVADFCGCAEAALQAELREALIASGDDEDAADDLVSAAEEFPTEMEERTDE